MFVYFPLNPFKHFEHNNFITLAVKIIWKDNQREREWLYTSKLFHTHEYIYVLFEHHCTTPRVSRPLFLSFSTLNPLSDAKKEERKAETEKLLGKQTGTLFLFDMKISKMTRNALCFPFFKKIVFSFLTSKIHNYAASEHSND